GEEIFALNNLSSGMYLTDKSLTANQASFTLHDYEKGIDGLQAFVAEYSGSTLIKVTGADIDRDSFTGSVTIPFTKENAADTTQLYVWEDMRPVPESKPEDITATVSVKNYTQNSGTVTAYACAIGGSASNGAETIIQGAADYKEFNSLDEKTLEIPIPLSKIPSDTSKLTIKLTTPKSSGTETAAAATLYRLQNAPVAAPADSNETTNGAHDPSIVKFPGDDTYYVYSSHHLIFTSKDLINWKKYDFTSKNVQTITPKTYNFIHDNLDTNVNGTYWAPDVIYKEGDDHPYWMYISVSCGIGGRSSAISLMKSNSPLFWADNSADIVDAGVVYATKQISSGDRTMKTNSIDANIYTDANGNQYFIWGSFWQGIQATKLKADGFIDGLDTSALPMAAQYYGRTIYAQKNGTAGPEGPWMIEHGNYRYLFTSYGWLGSNYNTRVARSPLSSDFASVVASVQGTASNQLTDTSFTDANGVKVGTEFADGNTKTLTGYKLIGSYRLGDGSYTLEGSDSAGYSIPREAGDAHIYYGPGHNSAINVGDESFYVSHTRKDATEIAATLQVRKMLWTSDGWPVVSPVTYAGEKEQKLPKSMLTGTYDLASVGRTKKTADNYGARNFDLPVVSSKVTLESGMSIKNANGTTIGTWE
ncbi:MAG: family 43 glycosylhydrolase, partial [Clostridia bacterium]|nr:family 43 glycosylhydrolase [Clostridia bacterium]